MPILARYILRTVFAYTLLVLAVLLVLGGLFLFINEQDDIGTGSYTATEAMTYVLFNIPTFATQLLPVAALIGALLGLGNLARGSELVVMRASGITTFRFCLWLAVAGILMAVVMAGVGEYVAPPLEKYGRQVKVFSKYNQFSFAGSRGAWVRDGDTIISVEQQSAKSRFGGIQLFHFGPDRELLAAGRADAPVEEFHSTLSPDFLGLAVVEPEAMGLRDLAAFIDHLRRNDLDSSGFEVALWSRVARMFALMLVLMLALPFSLGSMRSTGQGARMIVGIMIGAGFVLVSQTLENSGRLLGLSPLVTGWLPTALLAVLTVTMLVRAR
jgi:lipopolysaccharide export system permease protein